MSWPVVKLGDVCEHEILRVRTLPVEVEEINYIDIGSVQGKRVSQCKRLRRAEAPGRAQQIVQEGDVILSTVRPNLNTLAMITNYKEDCPLVASTGFCVLRAKSVVLPRFLYGWLQNPDVVRELSALAEAKASYPSVTDGEIFSLSLPLPSLPEQYDIVEELEWKLARLEKIEGNFRAMAETAAQASRSVLTGTFRSLDAPIVKLGDVCEVKGGGTPPISHPEYYGGGIPWATVRDMTSRFLEETERTITPLGVANSATNIIPSGNIVIATRVGLGKVCQLRQDTAINQDLRGFMPKSSAKLEPDYLYYWFRSMAPILEAMGTGATVKGVRINQVTSLLMPLPPLWDQKQIVEELEWKLSRLEKVERLAWEGLTVCEQARWAVLAEAFRQADGTALRQGCNAAGQAEPSAK